PGFLRGTEVPRRSPPGRARAPPLRSAPPPARRFEPATGGRAARAPARPAAPPAPPGCSLAWTRTATALPPSAARSPGLVRPPPQPGDSGWIGGTVASSAVGQVGSVGYSALRTVRTALLNSSPPAPRAPAPFLLPHPRTPLPPPPGSTRRGTPKGARRTVGA